MSGVKWDMFTCKNTNSAEKPNEDLALYNEKAHIGMLLDGVSRDKENGMYPVPSPSAVATKLFADEIQRLGGASDRDWIRRIRRDCNWCKSKGE